MLVWQWGRRGAGPRYALALARGLDAVPGVTGLLSLSRQAEIMATDAPQCDLPVDTYRSPTGYAWRLVSAPFGIRGLARRVLALAPDLAICAMPGPLDLLMASAVRRLGVPCVVVVHDADAHPGDGLPLQMRLQAALLRRADALIALSAHVAERLAGQSRPVLRSSLPPLAYDEAASTGARAVAPGERLRVLSFGRLLPYKGLDLLADAWRRLPTGAAELLVVGSGPHSPVLAALAALPGVTVQNRWVPEAEVGALFGGCDVVVLSHTEASQSGVAAAAQAAGRWIVATRVGGIAEQLRDDPRALLCDPRPEALAAALLSVRGLPPPAGAITATADAWRTMATELVAQLAPAVGGDVIVRRSR